MSVSAIFGSKLIIHPTPSFLSPATPRKLAGSIGGGGIGGNFGLLIECSSRPQKKATAHHRKTRPRKTQPWDIQRKPTVYPALPPLPPEWTFAKDDNVAESSAPQPPNQD